MINSACNHTRDKQIGLPLRGRLILLSLVRSQTELDSTRSYYHYLLKESIVKAFSTYSAVIELTYCCYDMKVKGYRAELFESRLTLTQG